MMAKKKQKKVPETFRCKQKVYTKLERVNNWENIYYTLADDSETQVVFSKGQKVHVKWPNGKKTQETVKLEHYSETVYDHGHNYEVSGKKPYITVSVNGLETKIEEELDNLLFLKSDLEFRSRRKKWVISK